jgi:NADH-quinone oxidoreductase subunit C
MAEDTKPNPSPEPGQPEAKPTAPVTPQAAPQAATPAAASKPAVPVAAAAPKAPAPPPKPPVPTPQPWECELTARLKKQYGSGIREASTYLGQNYLVVDRAIVHEILYEMRHDEAFDYCVDITSVHYPKKDQPFEVVYILYSFTKNTRVRIKTLLNDGEEVPTAVDLWPTANWLEREVFDMFGIRFTGHPDLKRILLPDGWKGHPLRKDYPILQQDKEWVQINLGIESGQ